MSLSPRLTQTIHLSSSARHDRKQCLLESGCTAAVLARTAGRAGVHPLAPRSDLERSSRAHRLTSIVTSTPSALQASCVPCTHDPCHVADEHTLAITSANGHLGKERRMHGLRMDTRSRTAAHTASRSIWCSVMQCSSHERTDKLKMSRISSRWPNQTRGQQAPPPRWVARPGHASAPSVT